MHFSIIFQYLFSFSSWMSPRRSPKDQGLVVGQTGVQSSHSGLQVCSVGWKITRRGGRGHGLTVFSLSTEGTAMTYMV